ncbi:MAG: rane protein [Rhodospirillales bacterium]|nr:rane protein [Rhodospirillales bacterium]
MKKILSGLAAGLVFGIGLTIAQMTNPAKVLAFLDLFGAWDPSLAFVMGGAVVVTFVGFRLLRTRAAPVCDTAMQWPTAAAIDARLIGGAALFGLGWGLVGLCPGPAIASLGIAPQRTVLFVAWMVIGMALVRWFVERRPVTAATV